MISTPDFATYPLDQFLPRITQAIDIARSHVANIKANPDAPTFENTLLPLEVADEELDALLSVFYGLLGTDSTDEMQALALQIGPMSSAFSSEVAQDEALFARIDALWQRRDELKLNTQQKAVLEKSWYGFVRNGAKLNGNEKAQLTAIDEELSTLGPKFEDNVRKSAKAFQLVIDNTDDLKGLPENAVTAAAETATERGLEGKWVFTLDYPSYVPFVTYAENRNLRETMWRAFTSRGLGGEFDNSDNVKRIVELRHQRAALLGYTSHAGYVLERRMAETPDTVRGFLARLKELSLPAAKRELEDLKAFAHNRDGLDTLKPWDSGYYAEKLKEARYAFDSEALRPYFSIDNVISGAFLHAEKLFGIVFSESRSYSRYHDEVRTFEVMDKNTGHVLGLLYTDFHPRASKRSGAWQGCFRERRVMRDGRIGLPLSAIVCNFTKPTKDQPSLLSFDEVETLFHELGHALHTLLTEIDYPSISGTSVYWDFVELPSQIMENWLTEKETLDLFAKHYQTGEAIPQKLIDGLKASQNFMAGMAVLRQLQFCTLDMEWHSRDPETITDIKAFEREVLDPLSLLPYEGGSVSNSFGHLFAGGYSAGYYSYQWAEVLDADAFAMFKEKGLYNQEVGNAFRREVLAKGGSEKPLALFRKFRGREPDPDASLRRRGLLDDKAA